MNTNRIIPKFLATFDEREGTQTPAPQAPPAAAPQVVPVESLGSIIDLSVQRALKANAPAPAQVAPVPLPTARTAAAPAAPSAEEGGLSAKEAAALRKEIRESNARAEMLALETYKLQAVAQAKAAGMGLIESLIWGTTQAEIDQAIRYSNQEYSRLAAEWQAQQAAAVAAVAAPGAPAAPAQQQQPPAATAPVGTVQQQAPMGVQTQQPIQQQAPQLPGFLSAGEMPGQPQQQGITPEQLAQVTSSHSVRNGQYAANRQALMDGLRGAAGQPQGQPWAFNPGYHVAPAVPRGTPQQAPAMGTNMYAGVQMPVVRPQHGTIQQQQMQHTPGITPNFNQNMVQRQAPQQQAFAPQGAPQPQDLDAGVALDGNAVNAAASAAAASINGMRGQAARMAPTH